MPSHVVTPDVLLQIAGHLRVGELKTLRIQPRKSGKNKGQLVADFGVKTRDENPSESDQLYRQRMAQVLERAAKELASGTLSRFEMSRKDDREAERYQYILETR